MSIGNGVHFFVFLKTLNFYLNIIKQFNLTKNPCFFAVNDYFWFRYFGRSNCHNTGSFSFSPFWHAKKMSFSRKNKIWHYVRVSCFWSSKVFSAFFSRILIHWFVSSPNMDFEGGPIFRKKFKFALNDSIIDAIVSVYHFLNTCEFAFFIDSFYLRLPIKTL